MALENNNKNGLALFSFEQGASGAEGSSRSSLKQNESTSPTAQVPGNNQLSSPVNSPVLMGKDSSIAMTMDSGNVPGDQDFIFERSVQDLCVGEPQTQQLPQPPRCNRCCTNRSRSCTHNSTISLQGGQYMKNEDCIPPALDATTSILNDKDTNLDDIEMVYSNRRNSSVIGLNMALGRPMCGSRKNSTYSLHQNQPQAQQTQSPISPPKLTSSKSSLSFYSYADMISSEELQRRPSFQQSYSQNFFPVNNKKKSHIGSLSSACKKSDPSLLSKQLSKKFPPTASPNQNFLILPESSDSEHYDNYYPEEKRKSVSSNISGNSGNSRPYNVKLDNDNESLVSSSVGDCLRQCTTEINGN